MNELFDCIRQLASKELPPEEIKAFRSPYDAAAKLAFSRKAVLGLLVKHGLMSAGEVESAETDFLENEFPLSFYPRFRDSKLRTAGLRPHSACEMRGEAFRLSRARDSEPP